jgi:hypothetical protein
MKKKCFLCSDFHFIQDKMKIEITKKRNDICLSGYLFYFTHIYVCQFYFKFFCGHLHVLCKCLFRFSLSFFFLSLSIIMNIIINIIIRNKNKAFLVVKNINLLFYNTEEMISSERKLE